MIKYLLSPLHLFLLTLFSISTYAVDYGIDRLFESEVKAKLEGKNLAVLTHAAGKNSSGEHLIDLLFKNFSLKKIFAPEHGLRTVFDDWVSDGIDEITSLPVISLYKRTTRAPSAQDLLGIDAIVIDLQDVGVRYYTYFSTVAEVMKACAPLNIEVILLDRPNLLGGKIIEGKVLDSELAENFTAYHTVPTRHGMTLGELALMINSEKKLGTKLTIITASGWKRENLLKQDDRVWIAPSPALIDIQQVGFYSLWGALENFNMAVGRGLTNQLAFRVLGAPWISATESRQLSAKLNLLGFNSVTFSPFFWDVTRALYVGKRAFGVKLNWSGKELRTDEFTYKVASVLVEMFKGRISSNNMAPQGYGSISMVNAIRNGTPWSEYQIIIDKELKIFAQRRIPFLLY